MKALWNLVWCTQPSYASFESVSTVQQIRSILGAINSADLVPRKMPTILQRMQNLSVEIQQMILEFAGPSLGLSLTAVLLATLPLLKGGRALPPNGRQFELSYSKEIYVRYITVRGQSYLSEISNEYSDGMGILLKPVNADSVVLSSDDLGIRGVCFIPNVPGPRPVEAPWYQHVKLTGDSILIKANVRSPNDHSCLAN